MDPALSYPRGDPALGWQNTGIPTAIDARFSYSWLWELKSYLSKCLLEIYTGIRDSQTREKIGSAITKRNNPCFRNISIQPLSPS